MKLVCLVGALGVACAPASRQVSDLAPVGGRDVEASASFRLPRSSDTAWMEVFVPAGARKIRAAVVFINRDDLLRYAFDDRDWRAMCARIQCALVRVGLPTRDNEKPELQFVRNAALGGDSAVFTALRIAGERTRHAELEKVGLVIFGYSASGNFGPTFAARHPDRTIGFVRYHSHLRGIPVDTARLAGIPALSIVGTTRDEADMMEDTKQLWSVLRRREAPVAFAAHSAVPHVSIDGLVEAGPALRGWTEAVVRSRTTSNTLLKPIEAADGWLLDDSTKRVTPASKTAAQSGTTSWLPNEETAFNLRRLYGMCASVGLRAATDLLGAGTQLTAEDVGVCHYANSQSRRDLWLSGFNYGTDSAALGRLRQPKRALPLSGIGVSAVFFADASNCSTIGAARSTWTFYVSACGAGFGVATDSGRLRPIAQTLIGQ